MKTLTLARDLKRRKSRERNRLFVAEGVRVVEELLRSSLRLRGALSSPQIADSPRGVRLVAALQARGVSIAAVDEREFASAAQTDSPQGVLAVAEIPERSLDTLELATTCRLLVLDGLQDPGNVGTIIRTAAALGAAATVSLPGTVDLWNAKVVRSAMGAHFHHPAFAITWEALDAFRERSRLALWGAVPEGAPLGAEGPVVPSRLGLVVGNEGAGLSAAAEGRLEHKVAIPLRPRVESLNVAVAAGILLFALRP